MSNNLDTETDGPDNTYLRRYLNDIITTKSTGPSVNLDEETDSEFTSYLRRYLNDT